uniref:Uncharacterized protein n=1 Tax=Ciona intestinalis TaxID=7719 RepID=F6W9W0_CIOIN
MLLLVAVQVDSSSARRRRMWIIWDEQPNEENTFDILTQLIEDHPSIPSNYVE